MSDNEPGSLAPLSLESLQEQLGFNLRLAYAAANRDFNERLAALNLTQRQCIALQLIAANSGVSQIDIAEALGIDRSSMMTIAEELNSRKLIVRRRSKRDRRKQELRLTAGGEDALKRILRLVREHDACLAASLSRREIDVFVANLRKIHRRF